MVMCFTKIFPALRSIGVYKQNKPQHVSLEWGDGNVGKLSIRFTKGISVGGLVSMLLISNLIMLLHPHHRVEIRAMCITCTVAVRAGTPKP